MFERILSFVLSGKLLVKWSPRPMGSFIPVLVSYTPAVRLTINHAYFDPKDINNVSSSEFFQIKKYGVPKKGAYGWASSPVATSWLLHTPLAACIPTAAQDGVYTRIFSCMCARRASTPGPSQCTEQINHHERAACRRPLSPSAWRENGPATQRILIK